MSTDVLKAAEPWMQVCGPHDYGVDTAPCGCPPDGDPRVIVSKLAAEVERLRVENERLERILLAAEKKAEQATTGRIEAERRLWNVRTVQCWTNEDGKRFAFADDLLAATDPDIVAQVRENAGGGA